MPGGREIPHLRASGHREGFRRKADALAFRLLRLLFSPVLPPAALAWRDGYLQGWQDATRCHLEEFTRGMGRSA